LGGDGNDFLKDTSGSNLLYGGSGSDQLYVTGSSNGNLLDGGSGNDNIFVDQGSHSNIINGESGDDDIFLMITWGNNIVYGGSGDDQITLYATTGNDTINGGEGNDHITLKDSSGDHQINGGDGNDTIYAFQSQNNNVFLGGNGSDVIILDGIGTTLQSVNGGNALDSLVLRAVYTQAPLSMQINPNGTAGSINSGTHQIVTFKNIETLYLNGTNFDDTISGGNGNDTLAGGNGNDHLTGGKGSDTLAGNDGIDTFAFNGFSQGIDVISDFTVASDIISISATGFGGGLIAGSLGADQFVVGSAAATADERFIYNDATGSLYFDQDGNANEFAQIELVGLATGLALTSNDFVVV